MSPFLGTDDVLTWGLLFKKTKWPDKTNQKQKCHSKQKRKQNNNGKVKEPKTNKTQKSSVLKFMLCIFCCLLKQDNGINYKAAISLTFDLHCKAIAALFFIPYRPIIWRHCRVFNPRGTAFLTAFLIGYLHEIYNLVTNQDQFSKYLEFTPQELHNHSSNVSDWLTNWYRLLFDQSADSSHGVKSR